MWIEKCFENLRHGVLHLPSFHLEKLMEKELEDDVLAHIRACFLPEVWPS
jgi:hypothetical protein